MVTKGPNFPPKKSNCNGISMSLLLINSAVTALVMNNPDRNTKSHWLLFNEYVPMEFI